MTWKLSVLLLAALSAAVPATAKHSCSETVVHGCDIDRSIAPGVYFHAFFCGGWMKKNPIPPDQANLGTYGKLEDDNRAQLRTILEEAGKANGASNKVKDDVTHGVTQKIGDYYASCMDEAAIEKFGVKPLLPELERIAGLKSKQDFAEYVATAQFPPSLDGGGTLFTFRSNQDFKDSTQVIAEADQGGLGLPDRDYYFKDDAQSEELRKAYLSHVAKMFELLGEKPADAATEAATVMLIETDLDKGQQARLQPRDP